MLILSYRNLVLFIKVSQQDAALRIMELHSFRNLFFIIIGIAVPTAVRTTVIITDINRRHAATDRSHTLSLNMIQGMLYQSLKLFTIHTESLVNMIGGKINILCTCLYMYSIALSDTAQCLSDIQHILSAHFL